MSICSSDLLCGDAARPSAVPHLIRPHGARRRGFREGVAASALSLSLSLSLCLYAITSQTDLACNRSCRRRLCSRGHWRTSPPFRTTNFTHFVLLAPLSVAHFSLPLFLPSSIFLPPSQINSDHDPHHSAVLGSCPWCAMPLSLSLLMQD